MGKEWEENFFGKELMITTEYFPSIPAILVEQNYIGNRKNKVPTSLTKSKWHRLLPFWKQQFDSQPNHRSSIPN